MTPNAFEDVYLKVHVEVPSQKDFLCQVGRLAATLYDLGYRRGLIYLVQGNRYKFQVYLAAKPVARNMEDTLPREIDLGTLPAEQG
jgi:hypothetical protein